MPDICADRWHRVPQDSLPRVDRAPSRPRAGRPASGPPPGAAGWSLSLSDHIVALPETPTAVASRVAGDFNEAYGWDTKYGTDSCAEFFGRLADGSYVDATRAAWPEEVTTQTAQPYQVDRIFGSDGLEVRLSADPKLCVGADEGLSDHLPITFTVAVPPRPLSAVPPAAAACPGAPAFDRTLG